MKWVAASLFLSFVLSGCVSRDEVEATVWLHNRVPSELCEQHPSLKSYGIYRRLDQGGFEFVSWCDQKSSEWLLLHKDDFKRFLDELLPEGGDE